MSSFLDFYEQELVDEKRGRVSKDPNHYKNVEFIKSYYPDRTIGRTNYTNYINGTRERFRKAIEAHDAQLLKDLQDDSLETLHQIIVTNNISLQKKKKVKPLGQAKSGTGRNLNWSKAEKDIVAGFSKLLQDNFFSYKNKNGNVHKVDDTRYEVKQAGGGRQSDIKISRADNEKVAVFIESKLNFLAAEYFKFGLPVFKDVLTKFLVKITVSDDLENMRLHIRAVEPEGDVSRKLSFKADYENFVGKKLHNVVIEPKK